MEEQLIAFALVRALEMIMLKELSDSPARRSFAKKDATRQNSPKPGGWERRGANDGVRLD